MKVLKLDLFQETACYKKPFAFKISETYPLPPYSTVNGMLHKILNAEELIPMAISIQGIYESIVNNYQSMYFYKDSTVTQMPLNIHLLYNVHLIIHVKADEEILNKIVEKIYSSDEFLSLGRREDLVRINSIKFVEVKEVDLEDDEDINYIKIKYPIYIPKNNIPCELKGINYRLNWKYNVKLKNKVREWEKLDVLYVDETQNGEEDFINDGVVLLDEDDDVVFFNA